RVADRAEVVGALAVEQRHPAAVGLGGGGVRGAESEKAGGERGRGDGGGPAWHGAFSLMCLVRRDCPRRLAGETIARARRGVPVSSCPRTRASTSCSRAKKQDVDGRDIGERSDAVLRTAMPGHDESFFYRFSSPAFCRTVSQRSSSPSIILPNSSGLELFTTTPALVSRSRPTGSATTASRVRFSLSFTVRGAPRWAKMSHQVVAS